MAKREDPVLLTNYRFLPSRLRGKVDEFIEKLDDVYREFAIKRYMEGKTICQIAEEMGYVERHIYSYKDRIIDLWELFSDQDRIEHHKIRIIKILQKYGNIKHTELCERLDFYRNGLSKSGFTDIIDSLIFNGTIKVHVINAGNKGRPGKEYTLNKPVINL